MSVRFLCLSAVSALVISACATSSQENPNYKYSTKYKAATPYQSAAHTQSSGTVVAQPVVYSSATTSAQPVTYVSSQPTTYVASQPATTTYVSSQPAAPIVYQSAQQPLAAPTQAGYTRVDQNCLRKEQNRELLGGAIGGTVGAIAGKKLVGGTKGTLLGAAVGGTAGYGLGDKSVNCDPVLVQSSAVTTQQPYAGQTYQAQPQPQTHYQQAQPQYGTTYASAPTAPQVQQMPAPSMAAPQTYTAPTDQVYGDTYGTPGYHAVMASQGQTQPAPAAQPAPVYAAPQPVYAAPQPTYAAPQPVYAAPAPAYQTQASMAGGGLHRVVEGDTVYSMSKRLCVTTQDIQRLNGLNANFNIKLGEHIKLPASRC